MPGHNILVIAHRGSNRDAPENSIEAFEKAISDGADRIETDLQWTRDGIPVLCHDDSTKRIASEAVRISQKNFSELSSVRLSNHETIPLLSQALETCLDRVEFNLEIKGKRSESELNELAKLILKSAHPEKIIVSCFYPEPLITLHRIAPDIKRAVLWGKDTLKINPGFYLNPAWMLDHCKSTVFHPEAGCLNQALMDLAHKQKWVVYPWVPMKGEKPGKKEKLWQKLYQLGIHGLCTNEPLAFKTWLEAHV